MWSRMFLFFTVLFVNDFCVTANDPVVVNDLIDSFLKDRLNKLGNKIKIGNITFHGLTLEDTELEGLQGFKRFDDFFVWDWYPDKGWSEIYGDLRADHIFLRSNKVTTDTTKLPPHSGWINISNTIIHVHYEAKFVEYPNCELEKELLAWKWMNDVIETSEGSFELSEDEINKFKKELACNKSIQNYFRILFMNKCLKHYKEHPSEYYFPIKDTPDFLE